MAHAVWDGGGELPSDDVGVLLSCGSGGGAEGVDGKVGVGGEELDEAGGGVSGGGETGWGGGRVLTAGRLCRLRRGCRP